MRIKQNIPTIEEVGKRVIYNLPLTFAQAMIYCNCKPSHLSKLLGMLRKNGIGTNTSCLKVQDLNYAIELCKKHKKQSEDSMQSEKTHKNILKIQFAERLKKLPKPTVQPIHTQEVNLKSKQSTFLRFVEE